MNNWAKELSTWCSGCVNWHLPLHCDGCFKFVCPVTHYKLITGLPACDTWVEHNPRAQEIMREYIQHKLHCSDHTEYENRS